MRIVARIIFKIADCFGSGLLMLAVRYYSKWLTLVKGRRVGLSFFSAVPWWWKRNGVSTYLHKTADDVLVTAASVVAVPEWIWQCGFLGRNRTNRAERWHERARARRTRTSGRGSLRFRENVADCGPIRFVRLSGRRFYGAFIHSDPFSGQLFRLPDLRCFRAPTEHERFSASMRSSTRH